MIETMQAHWLTILIISFTLLITPMYWFLILPFAKAIRMAWITAVVASLLLTMNLYNVVELLGSPGGALIGGLWILLPLLIWLKRDWFRGINQRPLLGLQIFRVIGGLFILEMARGHIPSSFALPAGIGDIIVGLVALWLVIGFKAPPRWGVIFVIVIGIIDFLGAFFFGFSSSDGPAQLFAKGFDNQLNMFPTGMIPLYLVPYAISFHVLSLINLNRK